jgi:hypothetical protein
LNPSEEKKATKSHFCLACQALNYETNNNKYPDEMETSHIKLNFDLSCNPRYGGGERATIVVNQRDTPK